MKTKPIADTFDISAEQAQLLASAQEQVNAAVERVGLIGQSILAGKGVTDRVIVELVPPKNGKGHQVKTRAS